MADEIQLIATKAMTYSTRRLQADDLFPAKRRDARLLVAIGKARYADETEEAPTKPKPAPKLVAKPKPVRRPKPKAR